ncbi:MAG TPA: hypothetical protein VF786_09355, partial [Terriglobales bacterium]
MFWFERNTAALLRRAVFLLLAVSPASLLFAQECMLGTDLSAGARATLDSTARQFVDLAARGDIATLRQDSIPSLAANFGTIEQAVNDNKQSFGNASVRREFVLDAASYPARQPRVEFFCGVYGANGHTANSAGFVLTNIDPGRYAIAVLDTSGAKGPYMVTVIMQQVGSQWKLAGFYPKAQSVNGHDANWFLQQARVYKQKGELHNAWFYYVMAWDMDAPVDFMSTAQLDQISNEMQQSRPSDLPAQNPMPLATAARTFNVTDMFPVVADGKLALVAKYQSNDVSNTALAFQDNTAVMRALLTRYPELRQAF